MNQLFTQRDVRKIFSDVPNKTLMRWVRLNLFEWDVELKDGRGKSRLYSMWNLYQIGVIRELGAVGIDFYLIRDIVDSHFKDYLHSQPRPSMRIAVARQKVKPSKSKIMTKLLIMMKCSPGREWKGMVAHFKEPSEDGSFFLGDTYTSVFAASVIVDLPVIAAQIEKRIKELNLDK